MTQSQNNPSLLRLDGVSKSYGEIQVVLNFSLDLQQGSFCCLLGPSGCGKSTVLRIIAGLDKPDTGAIYINGSDMVTVPSQKRGVGMVFQNYALFPHMDVFENIAFGLRGGASTKDIMFQVDKMLNMVRLGGYQKRLITELSGGEQQRVALARSLARNPQVLLLDEPFSNLDVQLKESMREELFELIEQVGITTILVTHDQDEAMALADTIVLMQSGTIEQIATPQELYYQPTSLFSASFVGKVNLFTRQEFEQVFSPGGMVPFDPTCRFIAIRPEFFQLSNSREQNIKVHIRRTTFHGSFFRYKAHILLEDSSQREILIEMPAGGKRLETGLEYVLSVDMAHICPLSQ